MNIKGIFCFLLLIYTNTSKYIQYIIGMVRVITIIKGIFFFFFFFFFYRNQYFKEYMKFCFSQNTFFLILTKE